MAGFYKMSNHLPFARVKTIMESVNRDTISKEPVQLVSIATELFIKNLAKKAEKESNGKEIEYKHIAEVVHTSIRHDFLREIIPRKVTVKQFKKLLEEKKARDDSSESEDTEIESNSSTTKEKQTDDNIYKNSSLDFK